MCLFHRVNLLSSFYSKTSVWVLAIWTPWCVVSPLECILHRAESLQEGVNSLDSSELHQNFHLE